MWRNVLVGMLTFFILSSKGMAAWEIYAEFKPDNQYYYVTITRFDQYDPTPNPLRRCGLAGGRLCQIYIGWSDNVGTGNGYMGGFSVPGMSEAETMGDLGKLIVDNGYLNRELRAMYGGSSQKGVRACFWLSYYDFGATILPNGPTLCSQPEITPTFCSISEPYIELLHGAVTGNVVNGHTISTPIHVSCSRDYSVAIVSADKNTTIDLGNGLKSDLKINGVDFNNGYVVTVGPSGKSFVLSSKLYGYSGRVGNFQGSKVIMLILP
ncbi:hypothetical protein JY494_26465 [Serratia marcescens]|nr:hypothetical protein [Serratia marcescens]